MQTFPHSFIGHFLRSDCLNGKVEEAAVVEESAESAQFTRNETSSGRVADQTIGTRGVDKGGGDESN